MIVVTNDASRPQENGGLTNQDFCDGQSPSTMLLDSEFLMK